MQSNQFAGNFFQMIEQSDNTQLQGEAPDNRVQRRRMLKSAVASYNDQAISMEVLLRDMSDTGVKIKLKENDVLPDNFHLYIEIDGINVECETVWRRGLEIGAKFVSEMETKTPLRSQTVIPTLMGKKPSLLRRKPIQP